MARHRAERPLMRRIRGIFGMAVAAGLALLVVVAPNGGGTYALWNTSSTITVGGTITAGRPAVRLDGFQKFNGFEYDADHVSVRKNITIYNTGNVTLRGLHLEGEAHNPEWDARVVRNATPTNAELGAIELAPNASTRVTITLTLSVEDINELIDIGATSSGMQARVTAQAGTGWVVSDESDVFVASVARDETDPGYEQEGGLLVWGSWGHHQVFAVLDAADIPAGVAPGTNFRVTGSYAGTTIDIKPDGLSTYNRQWSVQWEELRELWEKVDVGQSLPVFIRFIWDSPNGPTTIASGTFWVIRTAVNDVTLSITNPAGGNAPVPAPARAPAAPAPQAPATPAPEAPAQAPAPAPGPAETQTPAPAPAPESGEPAAPEPDSVAVEPPAPTPSPEPQPTPAPEPESQPAPEPEASPEPEAPVELGEVELEVAPNDDGDGLTLSWQNPAGTPDGTTYKLLLDGEATGDRTDTANLRFELPPTRIPTEFWTREADVHEVIVAIVAELPDGTNQPIAETTVWVVNGAEGTVTIHATDPSA